MKKTTCFVTKVAKKNLSKELFIKMFESSLQTKILVNYIYIYYFIYACYHNIFVFVFRWGSTVSLGCSEKNFFPKYKI